MEHELACRKRTKITVDTDGVPEVSGERKRQVARPAAWQTGDQSGEIDSPVTRSLPALAATPYNGAGDCPQLPTTAYVRHAPFVWRTISSDPLATARSFRADINNRSVLRALSNNNNSCLRLQQTQEADDNRDTNSTNRVWLHPLACAAAIITPAAH
ncbi:hypothetical protein BD289DRAFT_31813 [Coniella lustricola]|uniref:Uncharacterized protein n=1 Tax=Coniella lustricola TaxID=2025994 RepID=A0A2T3A2R5_9PEZI|nr:hypothetical protein BD289DRAFT_31813 [Coniella lustricola]